jgi:hypothetical protein
MAAPRHQDSATPADRLAPEASRSGTRTCFLFVIGQRGSTRRLLAAGRLAMLASAEAGGVARSASVSP